jgi:hypothetical protein
MILFGSGAIRSKNLLLGEKWDSTEAYFWEGESGNWPLVGHERTAEAAHNPVIPAKLREAGRSPC